MINAGGGLVSLGKCTRLGVRWWYFIVRWCYLVVRWWYFVVRCWYFIVRFTVRCWYFIVSSRWYSAFHEVLVLYLIH